MKGGTYDKRGNWNEEDWVIWHLLLVAEEQESSLMKHVALSMTRFRILVGST